MIQGLEIQLNQRRSKYISGMDIYSKSFENSGENYKISRKFYLRKHNQKKPRAFLKKKFTPKILKAKKFFHP